ncbi:MAG: hypothetical protein ACOYJ1_01070 [Peptococcales bacterium]|jgi:hypothetical protein
MSEKPKVPETTRKPASEQPKAPPPTPPADIYSAAEFVNNAKALFDASPDIAAAALDHSGFKEGTIDQARKVVKAFAERKV